MKAMKEERSGEKVRSCARVSCFEPRRRVRPRLRPRRWRAFHHPASPHTPSASIRPPAPAHPFATGGEAFPFTLGRCLALFDCARRSDPSADTHVVPPIFSLPSTLPSFACFLPPSSLACALRLVRGRLAVLVVGRLLQQALGVELTRQLHLDEPRLVLRRLVHETRVRREHLRSQQV